MVLIGLIGSLMFGLIIQVRYSLTSFDYTFELRDVVNFTWSFRSV